MPYIHPYPFFTFTPFFPFPFLLLPCVATAIGNSSLCPIGIGDKEIVENCADTVGHLTESSDPTVSKT